MDTARQMQTHPNKAVAVWAITPNGIALGRELCAKMDRMVLHIPNKEMYLVDSSAEGNPDVKTIGYDSLKSEIHDHFFDYKAHVFIFSTGIAIRMIHTLIESKTSDPAVVVMDERGRHAISLLSGHLGGGNALTHDISQAIGADPVITTATDINGLPSIDMIASKLNIKIETPENIKHINIKILKGLPSSIYDPGLWLAPEKLNGLHVQRVDPPNLESADLICTHEVKSVSRETLILRPPVLSVGIGCNRGTPAEEIIELIQKTFESHHLSILSISNLATIDIKSDEAGILAVSTMLNSPLELYTKEELNRVKGVLNPSDMAKKHIGATSVCEAAAIKGADDGKLIVAKHKTRNVTMAVAIKK